MIGNRKNGSRGRILMLLGNNPYPQDPRVLREATSLVESGYAVTVICPRWPSQPRREVMNGVAVRRFAPPPAVRGFVGYVLEYVYATVAALVLSAALLLRRGFDAVHAHNPPDTFVIVAALYKLLGKPFVYDHHDLAPEMYLVRFRDGGSPLVHRMLVLLEQLSCRLADHVITTNESQRAVEIERDRVSPDRITVVRNGPDLEILRPVEPDPEVRRRADTVLGYIGSMGYHDGVDHLLRALAHLVHDFGRRNTLAILVGDGDARPDLERLRRELDVEDHAWFPGFVPYEQVSRYLCAADVCVVPDPSNAYNDRSTMIKVMEYMALGKPIVAFDLPEHRITAQDAAVYVPPNDDLELARAIAALADDPQRCAEMGAAGRRRVEAELAWSHSAPHLLDAYAAVLR
jgi:glycosyltransferase involved in cell wall biosynthesis